MIPKLAPMSPLLILNRVMVYCFTNLKRMFRPVPFKFDSRYQIEWIFQMQKLCEGDIATQGVPQWLFARELGNCGRIRRKHLRAKGRENRGV